MKEEKKSYEKNMEDARRWSAQAQWISLAALVISAISLIMKAICL